MKITHFEMDEKERNFKKEKLHRVWKRLNKLESKPENQNNYVDAEKIVGLRRELDTLVKGINYDTFLEWIGEKNRESESLGK